MVEFSVGVNVVVSKEFVCVNIFGSLNFLWENIRRNNGVLVMFGKTEGLKANARLGFPISTSTESGAVDCEAVITHPTIFFSDPYILALS